ncbi:YwbE family protein [Paenibacillus puerhi]|uniref:YwbE family protein n=1 Tax=Paenibacillus puerhi TaxID=2692622 RepID=UPI0013572E5F|nr:YwbE family protein [Paenibacillus puerhi]
MNKAGQQRSQIRPGLEVDIVLKQDQRTGKTTRGIVKDILTNSPTHPHGIKVRLQNGQVGRVQSVISTDTSTGAGGSSS